MLIKDRVEHLHDYKRKETEIVFKEFSGQHSGICLEIGSGDGYEATLIRDYFDTLVSTEYKRDSFQVKKQDICYCRCNAEKLPFKDRSFDFVFSSNVIEHVRDKKLCLSEARRVLKKDGVAIHIVPSRTWKVFNNLLYYPYVLFLFFNIKELKWQIGEKARGAGALCILKYLFPPVHGDYRNHVDEFINYGRKEWQDLFIRNGFKVIKVIKLPLLSSGHGFNLRIISKFFEKKGLSSSYALFMATSE